MHHLLECECCDGDQRVVLRYRSVGTATAEHQAFGETSDSVFVTRVARACDTELRQALHRAQNRRLTGGCAPSHPPPTTVVREGEQGRSRQHKRRTSVFKVDVVVVYGKDAATVRLANGAGRTQITATTTAAQHSTAQQQTSDEPKEEDGGAVGE